MKRYFYLFLFTFFLYNSVWAETQKDPFESLLPVLTAPVEGQEITPKTTEELEKLFQTPKDTLPRLYVKKLPDDFAEKGSKELFAKVIGSLILRENEQILGEQYLFQLIKDKADKKIQWTKNEEAYFNSLVEKYDAIVLKTTQTKINDLLYKIDEIPISLAIAQSALQTNWGKKNMDSPYAQKGWQDLENYSDLIYSDLIQATKAYVIEMNATPNYTDWRMERMKNNTQMNRQASMRMAQGLRTYQPEDVNYVDKIRKLMHKNLFIFNLDKSKFSE